MSLSKSSFAFLLVCFLWNQPLAAQTTATVTTNAGDTSAGSFAAAATYLNSQGPGLVDFQFAGSGTVTLTTASSISFTQSVTFQGLPMNLIGRDNNESALLFQQGFTQSAGHDFTLANNGANSSGLDASVTAQNWNLGTAAGASLTGGNGAGILTSGSNGAAGGDAGNVVVATSSLNLGPSAFVEASGGTGGVGGSGDPGNVGGAGGRGGAVSASLGNLFLDGSSSMTLTGGSGGNGGDAVGGTGGAGGYGGDVSIAADSVTLNAGSSLGVLGGAGGAGGTSDVNGANGAQGGASVSFGSLNGFGSLVVTGGNASLQIAGGSFAGGINGNSGLEKVGAGDLTIAGYNQFTGGTTISGGSISVDTGGTLGSGYILNKSTLAYVNGASTGGLLISNSGAVFFKNNAGAEDSLIINNFYASFADNSSAGNCEIINNGSVQFNGNSSAGASSLFTFAGGSLAFLASSQGGTAAVNVDTGGTFDLSAHSGGMTIGSIAGLGFFNLGANNLTTGANNFNSVLEGIVSGTGGLVKIGTGTLFLSGSAVNDFSGGTLITDGILAVGKTSAFGNGSVILSGGTLESAGTALSFNIAGNYSQGSKGKFQVGLGGADAASSDLMSVAGNASLDGTLNLVGYSDLTGLAVGQSVTVMTASAVTGRFAMVDQSIDGMRFLPLYQGNSLALLSSVPSFEAVGLTGNQKTIGADLDHFFGVGKEYDLMLALVTQVPSSLPASFDRISPSAFASYFLTAFQTSGQQASFALGRMDQIHQSRSDRKSFSYGPDTGDSPRFAADLPASEEVAMASDTTRDGWNVFLNGAGGLLNVSDDSAAAGYKITTYGVTGAGMDRRFGEHLAAGILLGYGHADVAPNGGGAFTSDGGQLGLYGTWFSGIFYGDFFVMGGLNRYQSQRAGLDGTATGTTQGTQFSEAVEWGCLWKQQQIAFGPWVSAQATQMGLDGFNESGNSLAPLSLPSQSADSLLGQAGFKAEGTWKSGVLLFGPSLAAAWEHEFNFLGGNLQSGFGQGDSFTVSGPSLGQDGLAISVGLTVSFSKILSLSLDYRGELGRKNLDSQQINGGLSLNI